MEVLVLIPARGNSKGLARKNVQMIGGKPLIAHSICAAQGSKNVTRVIVSTDNFEIKQIAEAYGAEVIDRPIELSTDEATSESALVHALETLQEKESYAPDWMLFMQCTSPLTSSEDIDGIIEKCQADEADSALTVVNNHAFLWKQDEAGQFTGINHDKSERKRRQDLVPEYRENGALYLCRTTGFLEHKHRFFGKTTAFVMDESKALEIDSPADLTLLRTLFQEQSKAAKTQKLPAQIDAIILDFDGVFTENTVTVSETGEELVVCSRGDGMGINVFKKEFTSIPILVLSSEQNPVVKRRCEKLKLECIHGADVKITLLKKWAEEKGVDIKNIVYLGNDVNDLDCLHAVGCGVVVADAELEALDAADLILDKPGGKGAIRELMRLITDSIR